MNAPVLRCQVGPSRKSIICRMDGRIRLWSYDFGLRPVADALANPPPATKRVNPPRPPPESLCRRAVRLEGRQCGRPSPLAVVRDPRLRRAQDEAKIFSTP